MRKSCKRKVRALVNPITYAIDGARVTSEADIDKLRAVELASIDAFSRGMGTLGDVRTMCDMVNLCEQMARDNIGPEALDACERAQAGIIAMARSTEETAKIEIDSETLQALRDVYQYHDLQRQSISRAEYEREIARVRNRTISRAPGVIEL